MVDAIRTSIVIGDREFDVEEQSLPVTDLRFYEENPRIYSLIQEERLSQGEIESQMCAFDHVKTLVQSISTVGLLEPLIVRGAGMDVLEGNSRLAAFRVLCRRDPVKYGRVRCRVIIGEMADADVDTLLGQYHIVGRKDWDPYEQGAFLYRQVVRGRVPEDLAREYGMPKGEVKNLIRNYQFMCQHDVHDPKTWSYWDEYLSKRSIRKLREDTEVGDKLDALVVKQVLTGSIERAQDIRKLAEICEVVEDRRRGYILGDYLDEEISFADACEQIAAGANAASVIEKCRKFKAFINAADTRECIGGMGKSEKAELAYELKKIKIGTEQLT